MSRCRLPDHAEKSWFPILKRQGGEESVRTAWNQKASNGLTPISSHWRGAIPWIWNDHMSNQNFLYYTHAREQTGLLFYPPIADDHLPSYSGHLHSPYPHTQQPSQRVLQLFQTPVVLDLYWHLRLSLIQCLLWYPWLLILAMSVNLWRYRWLPRR